MAESVTLWFWKNCMKVNPGKFYLFLSDKKSHQVSICNEKFSSTRSERFLGIKSNNKLTFEEHMEGLCKKASQKASAVARISSLMRFEQRKRIVNFFITSHFSCCPLVWMFQSRRLNNNHIDHIHERALRIVYQDYNSSFKELLKKRQLLNKNVLTKCQKQKSFWILKDLIDRKSHRTCSARKAVLRNFAKFTGKHLRQSLFFDKVAML